MAKANRDDKQMTYPLRWPAWLQENVAEASLARAMSMATWLREAAQEKLERDRKPS